MQQADAVVQVLWKFVRGDVAAAEFEKWAYDKTDLEAELGKDLHLATISTDYSSKEAVWALRCALGGHVQSRSPAGCMCVRLRDLDVVDMGAFQAPEPAFEPGRSWSDEDVLGTWEEVKKRGPPYWWLWAARCRVCGQPWLVGQEERQNDVYCVKRLDDGEQRAVVHDDQWPPAFESYDVLLRVGLDAGRRVWFVEPETSSMRYTVADLARARPGIAVTELATLLSVDVALAKDLATKATKADGVNITFDTD